MQVSETGLKNSPVPQTLDVNRSSAKRSNETSPSENDSSIYPSTIHPSERVQLNNLFLNLKSSTRDSLITILVQFSSLLSGKAAYGAHRDKLIADISGLIEQLSDLQLRFDEHDEHDERPRKRVRRDEESAGKRELIFAVDWSTRSRILSLLIANKNFAFLNQTDSVNIRNNLVKQNASMIHTLLDFRTDSMELSTADDRGSDEETETETDTSLNGNSDFHFLMLSNC